MWLKWAAVGEGFSGLDLDLAPPSTTASWPRVFPPFEKHTQAYGDLTSHYNKTQLVHF